MNSRIEFRQAGEIARIQNDAAGMTCFHSGTFYHFPTNATTEQQAAYNNGYYGIVDDSCLDVHKPEEPILASGI